LENVYWIFLLNVFLLPLFTLINPLYLYKLGKRAYIERKEKKGEKNNMTQMEANKLYEGPNIDMPKKYSGIIRLMLFATFYAPAIPFALIFTLLGLTLWYWADKVKF